MTIRFIEFKTAYIESGSYTVSRKNRKNQSTPMIMMSSNYDQTTAAVEETLNVPVILPRMGGDKNNFFSERDQVESIPQFRLTHLLWRISTFGGYPSYKLVEYRGDKADQIYQDMVATTFTTLQQYAKFCFSDQGVFDGGSFQTDIEKVLPDKTVYTNANVNSSYIGDLLDEDGNVVQNFEVFLTPLRTGNMRPVFDYAYINSDILDGATAGESGIPSRIYRWQGGFDSSARIAVINGQEGVDGEVAGIEIGNTLDGVQRPAITQNVVHNGVTLQRAGMYNVSNPLRKI